MDYNYLPFRSRLLNAQLGGFICGGLGQFWKNNYLDLNIGFALQRAIRIPSKRLPRLEEWVSRNVFGSSLTYGIPPKRPTLYLGELNSIKLNEIIYDMLVNIPVKWIRPGKML